MARLVAAQDQVVAAVSSVDHSLATAAAALRESSPLDVKASTAQRRVADVVGDSASGSVVGDGGADSPQRRAPAASAFSALQARVRCLLLCACAWVATIGARVGSLPPRASLSACVSAAYLVYVWCVIWCESGVGGGAGSRGSP